MSRDNLQLTTKPFTLVTATSSAVFPPNISYKGPTTLDSSPTFQVLGLNFRTGGSGTGNLYAAPAVQAFTVTVTQTTTVDRSVVITDTAYNSVPVTITDFAVWTSTLPSRVVGIVWFCLHFVKSYD